MKRVFEVITDIKNDETKIRVNVKIQTSKYNLTQDELDRLKKRLEDDVVMLLMKNNYFASEIKFLK